jgi:hypothetical protein
MPAHPMIANRPRRNLSLAPLRRARIWFEDLGMTMMLSTTAKALVGLAVGILLLVAVAFAFAADLLSTPPKVVRAQAKLRHSDLYRGPVDPNVENVRLHATGSRSLRPLSFSRGETR